MSDAVAPSPAAEDSATLDALIAAQRGPIEYLPRLVSGVQPSSLIHLGHYFGALRRHIDLQHEYPGQMFVSIADYHALTRSPELPDLRAETVELATVYLALGVNVHKCILYRQSDVPQTFELYWILACLTSVSELVRLPPIRDAADASAGLLTYPVLMAADVLGLRGTHVPVGSDQVFNLERVREMARRFSKRYGPLLPCPQIMTTETQVIPGVDGAKMSAKTGNAIGIFERFPSLQQRVRRIKTDSRGAREPKDPSTCIVFRLYELVTTSTQINEMRDAYVRGTISYSEAKEKLIYAIQNYFAPLAERYETLKRRPDDVMDVLRYGLSAAAAEAEITIDAVRQRVGISS
jgi:tryptophanyl-tRNA synthetase